MNRQIKTIVFWLFIGISAVLLWSFVRATPQPRSGEISYSHFLLEVEAGSVESVSIAGQHIHGKYRDGRGAFQLVGPGNPGIYLDELRNKHVEVRFQETQDSPLALTLLGTWAPADNVGDIVVVYDPPDATDKTISVGRNPEGRREFGFSVRGVFLKVR
jgi:ATP-dependent Zn protease